MTPEDRKQFSEIMLALAENYPGTNLSVNGLKMRFEALREYSIADISNAATRLLKEHRFNTMPTVGDFVKVIDEASGKIPLEDKAEIEAGKVLSHLRRYGAATSPRFDDPITKQLMNGRWRYGSWARHVLESDLPWWRKEFIRAYKAHAVDARFLPAGGTLQKIAQGVIIRIPGGNMDVANV